MCNDTLWLYISFCHLGHVTKNASHHLEEYNRNNFLKAANDYFGTIELILQYQLVESFMFSRKDKFIVILVWCGTEYAVVNPTINTGLATINCLCLVKLML